MSVFESIAGGPFAFRLAWGLLHSLPSGALVAAALAAALPFLRGRPAARYAAGWLALLALAATVPLTAALAPVGVAPEAAAIEPPIAPAVPTVVAAPAAPAPAAVPGPPVASPAPAETPVPHPVAPPVVASAPVPAPADPWRSLRPFAPWIAWGWLAGAVVLAAWRLGGWFRLRGLGRGALPASAELQEALDRVARRLKVDRAVRLLESARVHVPAVVGWLRPAVLAPLGMLGGMPIDQVELILAHELAHVRRGDFLANLLQTAVETLLFYHPAAWWISRTIRAEREACCDDAVIAATGAPRLSYGRALAHLAELCAEPLSVPASGGDLLARVRRIVRPEPIRPLPQAADGLLALGATFAVAVLVAVPQAVKEAVAAEAPAGDRPKVVAVSPADGATDVPVETEIRIRFDRPMSPTATTLEWKIGGPAGYRTRGSWRYDADAHEFALPVRLTPGEKHELTLNREHPGGSGDRFVGFRSPDGPAAEVSRWSFTTAAPRPAPEGAPNPELVRQRPTINREVGLLTLVDLTFDRPMDPNAYGFARESDPLRGGPQILDVAYDTAAHRFTLLLSLPPNSNWRLLPQGFRSTEGAPARVTPLGYRTLDATTDDALRQAVEKAADSPKLREVVERAREASRKVESATIRAVVSYRFASPSLIGWHDRFTSQGATFRKAPGGKFRAEVDEVMGIPFRVGSDGTTCWADIPRGGAAAAPATAIDVENVSIADPFDAGGRATADELIRSRKLEYVGEADLNGRRCHQVRSWTVEVLGPGVVVLGPRWFLDAETSLPTRVESGPSYAVDFTYEDLNAPIPDDAFRAPAGVPPSADPGPLPEGYTKRFLNARDGSDGRMSVRWGMEGPKGRNSSGLN